jgi:hypothetical protein
MVCFDASDTYLRRRGWPAAAGGGGGLRGWRRGRPRSAPTLPSVGGGGARSQGQQPPEAAENTLERVTRTPEHLHTPLASRAATNIHTGERRAAAEPPGRRYRHHAGPTRNHSRRCRLARETHSRVQIPPSARRACHRNNSVSPIFVFFPLDEQSCL